MGSEQDTRSSEALKSPVDSSGFLFYATTYHSVYNFRFVRQQIHPKMSSADRQFAGRQFRGVIIRLLTWASNSFDKTISNQSITGEIVKFASFSPRIK